MLRKLILVGAFTGTAASVPIVYQQNPDAFEGMLRAVLEEPAPEPATPLVVVRKPAAEPGARMLTGKQVEIAVDARGHFEADFRLNGSRISSLVDTGATMVAINETTARRIGLSLTPADFKYEVNTANGTVKAAAAEIATLQIGRIYIDDVETVVLEDKALSKTLIGMSFLNRLAGYKVERGMMILEQ